MRLIKDVEDGKINNVLVYKIDRLTRSVKNLMELIELFDETGCAFNSLMEAIDTSTATGRMFIKIVGIFAEFERENLAERISLGYEQKAREGNYINTSGVNGYDYSLEKGDIVLNEEEAELIKEIFDKYLKGTSLSEICKDLNERKVPAKRGGKWWDSTLRSILSNPLYIGTIRYGFFTQKEEFTVENTRYAPIIDEEVFSRVQTVRQNRKQRTPRNYPSDTAYFYTFLSCGECGSVLNINHHKAPQVKTGTIYLLI